MAPPSRHSFLSWSAVRVPAAKPHPRVLLAEDDDELRRLVATTLRNEGYEVTAVSDGGRLLVRIAGAYDGAERSQETYDLLVSAQRMPVCSGIAILEQLRRARWPIPAILMTALEDPATRARGEALGAVVITKPFDVDELKTIAFKMAPLPVPSTLQSSRYPSALRTSEEERAAGEGADPWADPRVAVAISHTR
jgi:CheY-like chemotaxis protein